MTPLPLAADHGLETGDAIVYSRSGDKAVGGLEDGTTYYVIVGSDGAIQLAANRDDAVAANAVDLYDVDTNSGLVAGDGSTVTFDAAAAVDRDADTILLGSGHGLSTGDALVYHRDGDQMIGGLADESTYYVIVGFGGTIQLAASSNDAVNGVAIDLGAADTNSLLSPQAGSKVSFDVADDVNAATDSIHLEPGHGLETGDALTYSNGNGVDVAGLEDGVTYYVITSADPDVDGTIQLAASLADALAGIAVDIGETIAGGSTVDAGGSVRLAATDDSEINSIAVGVSGTGGGAFGAAVSSNVIANTTVTEIGSTVLESTGAVELDSTSSAIVRSLAVGVSGSGIAAVRMNVLGNAIANDTSAVIDGSSITVAGDVKLSAAEEAPDMLGLMDTIGEYLLDDQTKDALEASLSGSAFDPDANILSLNVSVAGTGGVAINGAFTGNSITNNLTTEIADSTVTSTGGDVILTTTSDAGILAMTVGVAGSGVVAVNATGFGNVISNRLSATIEEGSVVTTEAADGAVTLTASDVSQIRSAGVSVAATGGVAAGALIGANVIANSVISEISGSTVNSGSTLELTATNDSNILGLTVGVASSGIAAGLLSMSGNTITNTTRAAIVSEEDADGTDSAIHAADSVTLSATDSSQINSVAIGVSRSGGGAVGAAIAVNAVGNSTETEVSGTVLETAGSLSLNATTGAVIRTLAVGVSGSVGFAVQATVLGNAIINNTSAIISDATVAAGGDVQLTAADKAPSIVDLDIIDDLASYITDGSMSTAINNALDDTPFDASANIISLNVSVSGSGAAAINGAFTGNVIANDVTTAVENSLVLSGATASAAYDASDGLDSTDFDLVGDGSLALSSVSSAGILSGTIGVAAAAGFAMDATGFGNDISNNVTATISGSEVGAAGNVVLDASDDSMIRSLGIGVAGSGTGAVSIVVGANQINNLVAAQIAGSDLTTGAAEHDGNSAVGVSLNAQSNADILSFGGGVAITGFTGFQATAVSNTVSNTVVASIGDYLTVRDDLLITEQGTTDSTVISDGSVLLSAADSSTIDALGFGVAGSGMGGAVGVVLASNVIANNISSAVRGATIETDEDLELTSVSSAVIRALSLGVSASSDLSFTATVLGNSVTNEVTAKIEDATVTAADDISLYAGDIAPSSIPDWLVGGYADELADALAEAESPIDLTSNILSLSLSVSGSGLAAISGIFTGNIISNTVASDVTNSTLRAGRTEDGVISNGSADISLTSESKAGIISATVGIGASSVVAGSLVGFGNQISNNISSRVEGGSTVLSGGLIELSASDDSSIRSIGLSIAASGGVGVSAIAGVNQISNSVETLISGSTVVAGSTLDLTAQAEADILSYVGGVAAAGVVSAQVSYGVNDISNSVTSTVQSAQLTAVDAVTIKAQDLSTINTLTIGLSAAGGGAIGAAVAENDIANHTEASLNTATVESTTGSVSVISESKATISSLAAGLSGSLLASGSGSKTKNILAGSIVSSVTDSSVFAAGSVSVTATDGTPDTVDNILADDGYLSKDDLELIKDSMDQSPQKATGDLDSNILSLAVSIAVAGAGAASAAVSENSIGNTVEATVDNSQLTSTGSDIDVSVHSTATIASLAFGAGGSLGLSASASVSDNSIHNTLSASVLHGSVLNAADDIFISSNDSSLIRALGVSLSFALGGAGGAVDVDNTVTTTNSAALQGATTRIDQADEVSISATSDYSVWGSALSATASTVAQGTSSVEANIGGSTSATIDGALIGQSDEGQVRAVAVTAESVSHVTSYGYSLAAGLKKIGTNYAKATINPTIKAEISDARITVTGGVKLDAISEADATAYLNSHTLGGVSGGTMEATASIAPTVNSRITGDSTVIAGADIRIRSWHNMNSDGFIDKGATATAESATGSLHDNQGAKPTATSNATVVSQLGANAVLVSGHKVAVVARSHNQAHATSKSLIFAAALSTGNSIVSATAKGTTSAYLDGNVTVADYLSILALGISSSSTRTEGVKVSLATGNSSNATATTSPNINARIGNGETAASVNAGGTISLVGQAQTSAKAVAKETSHAVAPKGSMHADAIINSDIDVSVGTGSSVTSESGNLYLRALHNMTNVKHSSIQDNTGATATAYSNGLGLVNSTGASAVSTITAEVDITLGNGVVMNAENGNMALFSSAYNNAIANVDGTAYGLAAAGALDGSVSIAGHTLVTEQQNGALNAGEDLSLTAQTVNNAMVDGKGGAGGLLAIGGVNVEASVKNFITKVWVRLNSQLTAGATMTVQALNSDVISAVAEQDSSAGVANVVVNASATLSKNTTEVVLGNNSSLTAEDVVVRAQDVMTAVSANASSTTYQAAGTSRATATVNGTSVARVRMYSGASIYAPGSITMSSLQSNFSTNAMADTSIKAGLTGRLYSTATNNLHGDSNIRTDSRSTLTTSNLLIEASTDRVKDGYKVIANTDAETVVEYVKDVVGTACKTIFKILTFGLWDGKEVCKPVMDWVQVITNSDTKGVTSGSQHRASQIVLNSTVIVLAPSASLSVAEDHTLTADGISATVDEDNGQVVVADIENQSLGTVTIDSIRGTLTGKATFYFETNMGVTIVNQSDLDLVLNNVDTLLNSVDSVPLTFNVSKSKMTDFNYSYETGYGETDVAISNATGKLYLQGAIDASYGNVIITSSGSIISSGEAITARTLTMTSDGDIGTESFGLTADLVQVADAAGTILNPELTLTAAGNLYAAISGVDRDYNDSEGFVAYVHDASGTGTVDLSFGNVQQVSESSSSASVTLTAGTVSNVVDISDGSASGNDYSLSGITYAAAMTTPNSDTDPTAGSSAVLGYGASSTLGLSLTAGRQTFAVSAVNYDDDEITLAGHGFSAGESVVFSAGTDTIGGLSNGTYTIEVVDADTIRLRDADGNLVNLTNIYTGAEGAPVASGAADISLVSAEDLYLADTGSLTVGSAVLYQLDPGSTAIGGLTSSSVYYVLSIDATTNQITLSSSRGGAAISNGGGSYRIGLIDQLYVGDNSYAVGDALVYDSGADAAFGGLTDGATYYVSAVTADGYISLAESYSAAMSSEAIVLDPTGVESSDDSLTALWSSSQLVETFNAAAVDSVAHSLTLNGNLFTTGEAVLYRDSGGTSGIAGLTSGTTYYTIVSGDSVQLAASYADALAGNAIDLGSASGQQLTLTSLEAIVLDAAHGYTTGDKVTYSSGSGDAIGGLTSGQSYYVIVVDDSTIRLAATSSNAEAGTAIILDISAASGDDHSFGIGNVITYTDHGFANGQAVVYSTDGDAIGGLTSGTTYYVIKTGADTFMLAASQADAEAGIPVSIDLDQRTASGNQHFDVVLNIAATDYHAEILRFAKGHRYETGDAVVYHAGSTGSIGGLVDGQTYYVVKLSGSSIQLASSLADAVASATSVDVEIELAELGENAAPVVAVDDTTTAGVTVITITLNTTSGSENTVQELIDAINNDATAAALLNASLTGGSGEILATGSAWSTISLSSIRDNLTLPFYDAESSDVVRGTFVLENSSDASGSTSSTLTIDGGSNQIELAGAISYGDAVTISTDGAILSSSAEQLISSANISLTGGAGIGTADSPILVDLGSGALSATSAADIFLTEVNGDMTLGTLVTTGNATLVSDGAILGIAGASADLSAATLTLTATTGIGSADQAVTVTAERLTATAAADIHLAGVGDLNIDQVTSTGGDLILSASGSLLDVNADELTNLSGHSIQLSAGGAVGSDDNLLDIDTAAESDGLLTVAAGAGVYLREASGALAVGRIETTTGDVELVVPDTVNAGNDLSIGEGIYALAGSISLSVGDNISLAAEASLSAAGNVTILADADDADAGTGAQLSLQGAIVADTLSISGGADADTIELARVSVTTAQVTGGAGDDEIILGNADGLLDQLQGDITIAGGDGIDALIINDSGDTQANSGTLSDSSVTGLGITGSVNYGSVETVDLALGSAADQLTITGTAQIVTRVDLGDGEDTVELQASQGVLSLQGNAGSDQINVRGTSGIVIIDGGSDGDTIHIGASDDTLDAMTGFVSIVGSDGDDLLEVVDTGSNLDRSGSLRADSLRGFGMSLNGADLTSQVTAVENATGLDVDSLLGFDLASELAANSSVHYQQQETLSIELGSGGDTVEIDSPMAGDTSLDTGAGDDQIEILSNAGSLEIQTGAGEDELQLYATVGDVAIDMGTAADRVTVGPTLESIQGQVTLIGHDDTDQLIFDNRGDATDNSGILGEDSLSGFGMRHAISFNTFEDINLSLGSGSDDLTITETITGTTTVSGGAGDDQLTVEHSRGTLSVNGDAGQDTLTLRTTDGSVFIDGGNDADLIQLGSTAGLADGLQGSITLEGGDGQDRLIFNDSGDTQANSGTLSDSSVTGLGITGSVNYGSVETVDLALGSAADQLTITGTAQIVTRVDLGDGEDTVELQASQGVLSLQGNAGSDQINVRGTSGIVIIDGGSDGDTIHIGASDDTLDAMTGFVSIVGSDGDDLLEVVDTGSNLDRSGTLRADSLRGFGMSLNGADLTSQVTAVENATGLDVDSLLGLDLASELAANSSVHYQQQETLTIELGSGSDTVEVASTMVGDTSLDTGAGDDQIGILSNTGTLDVQAGAGEDQLQLNATAGDVTIDMGADADRVTVGPTLESIQGLVTLAGNDDTDQLIFDNSGDATDRSGTLTEDSLSGFGMGHAISFNTFENINLTLGSGSDDLTISETINGTTTVSGGAGDDQLTVEHSRGTLSVNGDAGQDTLTLRTTDGSVFIDGGNDADLIQLGSTAGLADGLQGSITLEGGDGQDRLILDDSGDSSDNSATLTATTLTGLGMSDGINYAGVEELTVQLGSGDDTFNAQSTLAGTATSVFGNGGDDSFNLCSDAPTNDGTLDGLDGTLSIDGGAGENTAVLSDLGNDSGREGLVLDEQSVSGLGDSAGGLLNYAEIDNLGLYLGGGSDQLTLTGTNVDTVTMINTGGGDDQVTLRDESAGTDGLTVIFGGAGNDWIDGGGWTDDLLLVGDNGRFDFSAGVPVALQNYRSAGDGDDTLIGGQGNDVLLGGMGNDYLEGQGGNDVIIGDLGKVSWQHGSISKVATTDIFNGGDDTLVGGTGNDIMLGGHGSDLFYGSFSEDIMVGNNGQVTLKDGKFESLVTPSGGHLDLLVNAQEGLYQNKPVDSSWGDFDESMFRGQHDAAEPQETAAPALTGTSYAERVVHHSGHGPRVVAKPSTGQSKSPAAAPDAQPQVEQQEPVEERRAMPQQPESNAPAKNLPSGTQVGEAGARDDEPTDTGLSTLVAGLAGWSFAPSVGKNSNGLLSVADLKKSSQAAGRSWTWNKGSLKKGKSKRSDLKIRPDHFRYVKEVRNEESAEQMKSYQP